MTNTCNLRSSQEIDLENKKVPKDHRSAQCEVYSLALRRKREPSGDFSPGSHRWDFPGGSDGKVSAYNAGDPGSIPGSGRSPREGNGNPLQYSCLENPMEGGSCYTSWARKESDTTERLHFHFPTDGVGGALLVFLLQEVLGHSSLHYKMPSHQKELR